MAKCEFCDKGVVFGIQVSHSHRRSSTAPRSTSMCALIASVRAKLPALSDPAKTKKHRLMPVLFSCPSVWAMVYCIHISTRNNKTGALLAPDDGRGGIMASQSSIKLTKLVERFELKVLNEGKNYDRCLIRADDINRPA